MSGVWVVGGKNRIVLHLTYSDQTPIHSRKNEESFGGTFCRTHRARFEKTGIE
jgi:hypothetical protein